MTGQRQSKVHHWCLCHSQQLLLSNSSQLQRTPAVMTVANINQNQMSWGRGKPKDSKRCKQQPDNTGDDRKSNCACWTTEYHAKVSNGPTSGPALILVSVSGPLSRDFDPRRPQAVLVQRQPKTPEKGFTHNSECSIRNDGGMEGWMETSPLDVIVVHCMCTKTNDQMRCTVLIFF